LNGNRGDFFISPFKRRWKYAITRRNIDKTLYSGKILLDIALLQISDDERIVWLENNLHAFPGAFSLLKKMIDREQGSAVKNNRFERQEKLLSLM